MQRINGNLVAKLGLRPDNQQQVRHGFYHAFLKAGILHKVSRIVNQQGVPTLDSVPTEFVWDEDRDIDVPGLTASVRPPAPKHPCSQIFWYCPTGGTIDVKSGSLGGLLLIKDFGNPELVSCYEELKRLRHEDSDFDREYRSVVGRLVRESKKVDPADPNAIHNFLRRVFSEVEKTGISRRLAEGNPASPLRTFETSEPATLSTPR